MSLSAALEEQLISVPCPQCGYEFDIELADVVCQVYRWCPCCRVRIRLSERRADVYGPLQDVDSAVRDLEKTIDKVNKELRRIF